MRALELTRGQIKRFKDTVLKPVLFKLKHEQIVVFIMTDYFHHKSECQKKPHI